MISTFKIIIIGERVILLLCPLSSFVCFKTILCPSMWEVVIFLHLVPSNNLIA